MSNSIDDFMSEVAANNPKPEHEKFIFDNEDELVAAINRTCRMIALGDETRFVIRDDKGMPRFLRRRDAETELAQYQLVLESETKDGHKKFKILPGFAVWLKSDQRLPKYQRRVFNPNEDDVGEDDLNMWTGFAVNPAQGNWSLLRNHIRENICNGSEEHFLYLLAWMAQLFQEPGRKTGVAPVLRGPKGVGKSKLSDWLRYVIGDRHAMVADKKDQWTGKFTEQLRLLILLTCEEALFAGSHEQDSSIKHLISSEDFSYEAKGKDIVSGKNYTRVFVTANEDWVVPTTPGERRFFVLDVGTNQRKNSKYFAAIDEQMKSGGAEAMLYELLTLDYSGIDLRNPPETDALKEQIEIGLKADLAWLVSVLSEGEFPFLDRARRAVEWPDEPQSKEGKEPTQEEIVAEGSKRYLLKSDIQDSFRDFVPGRRNRPVTTSAVGKFLTKNVPGVEGVKKRVKAYGGGEGTLTPYYHLPWLSDARAAFLRANPGVTFAASDKVVKDNENKEGVEMPQQAEMPDAAKMKDRTSNVLDMRRDMRRSRF